MRLHLRHVAISSLLGSALVAPAVLTQAPFALVGCGSANIEFAPDPVDSGKPVDSGTGGGDTGSNPDGLVADTGSSDGSSEVATDAPVDTFDPEKDGDGDGYKAKDDCNDSDPLVNPGAYEIPGDKIDNDCDGKVDVIAPSCDIGDLKLDSADASDFAKALGLCQSTTAEATGKDKKWGVIKAELVTVDGAGKPDALQHGLQTKFGAVIVPREGKNVVVLSSGTARTPGQTGFAVPMSPSFKTTSEVAPPKGWPKLVTGCTAPTTTTANDSIALKLTIRVPTNAKSFHYDFDFFTSEYLAYACSAYADQFAALLDSKVALDAKYAGNISFDGKDRPISVNNTSFLEVCTPGTKTSTGTPAVTLDYKCAKGTKELEGTGFWDATKPAENGSTSWLETNAAVQPGETITIQFAIWDVEDHILDSTVLLDNWRWDPTAPATPVTARPAK